MPNQMPDSITRVLLAALNAADEVVERNSEFAEPVSAEAVPVAKALAGLTSMQVLDVADDRQNRFAATIRLSMDKFRAAS
ncbi:hypothetical protein [Bradyrhizobium sp. AS23.2]|uniref:hypothetical protein n=1 Tax=Bradyrhizobium sp. AS23.2 TaxID=1680155 RepID=UPI00093E12F2|nr:hypothetical protein [Bradyrhizobium sp. AS23.2]OKO86840.1 hypothetical protein AC630_01990 [Bradyrhizobium sp. AS23.2]